MSYPLLTSLFFFALFLPSCQPDLAGEPDTLTIALESGPTQLDPRLSTDLASSHISQLVYSSLLKVGAEGKLAPDLAKKWEAPDDRTVMVQLKKGVRFHSGKELNAEDVQYTFRSLINPDLKSPRAAAYDKLESIETPSPYRVIFRLKEPYAPFLYSLAQEILPKEVNNSPAPSPIQKLVGTGPFQFVRHTTDEEVVLKANPDYFEGPPKIKKLIFRIIPDETIRVLELEKGNIDFMQNAFSPDILPRFKKNDTLKIVEKLGTNYSYIGFNLKDPVLKNQKVREAIACGIDRHKITKTILKGMAKPADGPLTSDHWAFEPHVARYPYDPDKARKLLDQAGYPDPDGNGPLPRLTLSYKTSQNELRKLIGEILVEQLAEIGIEVKMRSYEWGTFYGDIKTGNFQMFTLTWVGIRDPDFFREVFHSENIPPKGANRGRFWNPEINRLTELGAKTLDREKRRNIYSKIQKIIAKELPYASLWHSVNAAVMKKNIQGFKIYPDESIASLKRVYFSEN